MLSNFILRYLNYAKDPIFKYSSESNIDSNAIYNCIQNIQDCGRHGLIVRHQEWIGATLDNFIQGQTAMEIVFLNYASNIIHLQKNTHGGQIGYAKIPGGNSYVTGGTFSILAGSKNNSAAKEYIHWVCSLQQAELFTMCGGISPYSHVYQNNEILSQYPWYQHLPDIIQTGYGRSLWDAINIHELQTNSFEILRGIIQNKIDLKTGSKQMCTAINASLLK